MAAWDWVLFFGWVVLGLALDIFFQRSGFWWRTGCPLGLLGELAPGENLAPQLFAQRLLTCSIKLPDTWNPGGRDPHLGGFSPHFDEQPTVHVRFRHSEAGGFDTRYTLKVAGLWLYIHLNLVS